MGDYANTGRFMSETTSPERAARQSSPRKARLTGASLAGFLENRSKGKISKKIDKYNEEYARLSDLAAQVDIERKEVEEGTLDYAEVQKSIKAYNAQARRLADIGVEVLVLNQDIQKITFGKEHAAKAIKVPSFLIGPLRLLSAAGREQARLERERREETENAIYQSIVTTAEEALGQVKDSQIDVDKFDSLEVGNVAETVVADLVSEPSTDIPVEETETPVVEETAEEVVEVAPVETVVTEPEKTPAELEQEAEERRKAAAEAVAKRNEAISAGLNKAYRNVPSPKKYRESEAAVKKAVAEDDNFAILANVAESFHLALVKNGSGHAEMLEVFVNGERKLITPSMFGKMSGLENKEEIMATYVNMVAISKFASHWDKVAVYELQESEDSVRRVEAFGEENANVFNFVVGNVREGLSAEEITAKANEELSAVEANVVAAVVANYDVVKAGVAAMDSFMEVKEKAPEAVAEDVQVNDEMIVKKRQAVAETIAKLAAVKYGLTAPVVEEEAVVESTVTEEGPALVEEETELVEDTIVVGGEDVTPEEVVAEETPVVKPTGTSYVSQIGVLVDEISALSTHRARLREILGDVEANEQLATLDSAIANKLAQINALALGGIVTLGKDEHTNVVEETPVVEEENILGEGVVEPATEVVEEVAPEEVTPVAEETTLVEEETVVIPEPTAVVPDAASIEMSIEEKAEIDARVVNGAHVKVDAIIENFIPGKKYVLEARVKGKKATVVIEDEEEQLVETVNTDNVVVEETPVIEEVTPVVEEENNLGNVTGEPAAEVVEEAELVNVQAAEEEVIDEEHADVIDWWTRMGPTLDDPDTQMALRLQGALKEADRAASQANFEIDKRNWEANRAQRIADGWLPQDEEARQARIAEQERIAEQIARNKLKKCKLFEGLDDPDEYIDGIIAENDDLNNARDVVEMIRTKAPEAYKEMETRYRDEQHEKLAALSEETRGRAK